jgi:asparagine synthase (glutamine-hydrolysing)
MTMAHGLEVRVPFVDHLLIESVWPELGFHPPLLERKSALTSTLERPLPAEVVGHPKQGFTLPFDRWIAGELAPLVRDGIGRLAAAGWIAPEAPERVWRDWQSGATHWSRPWGLAVLGHCLNGAAA